MSTGSPLVRFGSFKVNKSLHKLLNCLGGDFNDSAVSIDLVVLVTLLSLDYTVVYVDYYMLAQ